MFSFNRESDGQEVNRERSRLHAISSPDSYLRKSFDTAARALRTAVPPEQFSEAVTLLGDLFCNQVRAQNASPLMDVQWKVALEGGLALNRLQIAAELSRVYADREKIVGRNEVALSLSERFVVQFIDDLLTQPLDPVHGAASEIKAFFKSLPVIVGHLHQCLSMMGDRINPNTEQKAESLGLAALYLITQNNMSAAAALELIKAVSADPRREKREEMIDRFRCLACDAKVFARFADDRMAAPLGRAAFMTAFKEYYPNNAPEDPNYRPAEFGNVNVPDTRLYWDYVSQRLQALSRVKDPDDRQDRIYRYTNLIADTIAGRPFIDKEERYFRGIHLHGGADMDPAHLAFYTNVYGVDNGPGVENSYEVQKNLQETSERFRYLVATRYSLNSRKSYALTLPSGRWLLEEIAEEVGGKAVRVAAKGPDAYPGHGTVLSGINVRNALDFSTEERAARYLEICPWLKAGAGSLHNANLIFTRGWIAIARSAQLRGTPLDSMWRGNIEGEPYVAMWFNDHFQNNRLPEVRMWLVPEKVFYAKFQFALENRVPLNLLDLTPEGLVEAANAAGLPILSIGTSSCLYGSLANSWPFGKGQVHGWEPGNSWRGTRWQDPFHIHRSLASGDYIYEVNDEAESLFRKVRIEHAKVLSALRFFEDLHSSFLSVEEAWAKEYARPGEKPAEAFTPPSPDRGSGRSNDDLPRERTERADRSGGRDFEPPQNDPDGNVPLPQFRTRLLHAFIELRNRIAERNPDAGLHEFPMLELQYTRLFARQGDTPFISGGDLCLHLGNGRRIPLAGKPGEVAKRVHLTDLMEAAWYDKFVSRFAPNNCPRIIFP